MDEKIPVLDLKILPAWLKEQPVANPYADFQGEEAPRGRGDRRGEDRGRGDNRRRDAPRGGERRENRGPRPQGQGRGPRPQQGSGRPQGPDRGPGDRQGRRQETGPQRPPPAPQAPPLLHIGIEFVPERSCAESLAAQVKSGNQAYPIFALARMFLEKADRYQVRITSKDAEKPVYQAGSGGPIALAPGLVEKEAFQALKERFYIEETIQRDPPKGNYSNVARCRLNGALLGPTNHHSYQPGLRRLYEERFSRRMSFQDFQREIEIVSDPEVINAWKETVRSVTTFKTRDETDPVLFETENDAEQHFLKTYLPKELTSGQTFEISGENSRNLTDRRLFGSVRDAWEKERGFPGHLAHHLRRFFLDAGLHIFKHRKRMMYVSPIRPVPFKGDPATLSENIAGILRIVGATPKCTRAELAVKLLPQGIDDPARKTALAADLHYLIKAGQVIEFFDATLDLPLLPQPPHAPPKRNQENQAQQTEPGQPAAMPASADLPEPVASIPVSDPAAPRSVESIPPVQPEAPPPELAAEIISIPIAEPPLGNTPDPGPTATQPISSQHKPSSDPDPQTP